MRVKVKSFRTASAGACLRGISPRGRLSLDFVPAVLRKRAMRLIEWAQFDPILAVGALDRSLKHETSLDISVRISFRPLRMMTGRLRQLRGNRQEIASPLLLTLFMKGVPAIRTAGGFMRDNSDMTKNERNELLSRISADPSVCSGKPCIRGHRISVSLVLDYLANGMTKEEILAEYPQLDEKDIRACIAYGAELSKEHFVDLESL
ncbi:MAG TPA: DUF433 domain-containing protein [Candidatus Obscuribacterales bacterium]